MPLCTHSRRTHCPSEKQVTKRGQRTRCHGWNCTRYDHTDDQFKFTAHHSAPQTCREKNLNSCHRENVRPRQYERTLIGRRRVQYGSIWHTSGFAMPCQMYSGQTSHPDNACRRSPQSRIQSVHNPLRRQQNGHKGGEQKRDDEGQTKSEN